MELFRGVARSPVAPRSEARGVRLDVAVSYTYRAHWDLTAMCARDAARYGPAIEAAREGLRVFAERRARTPR